MSFARPVVQAERDLSATSLREVLHGGALEDVLTNEAVGVFVRATLPGVVGGGEVERGVRGSFDLAVAVKLCPVIDGDGLEQVPVSADELNDAAVRG